MSKNSVDKLKLKSGEYYDFKPEGYDELVAKVTELKALASTGSGSGSGTNPVYIHTTYDIVDELKLKSGQVYNFKPEGYDILVSTVDELMDQANLVYEPEDHSADTQPVENHYSENVAAGELAYLVPEEEEEPDPTPHSDPFDPDAFTFDWEDGDLKIYESGYCRVGSGIVSKLWDKPADKEISSFEFDSDNYTFESDTETINEDGDSVSRKYVTISKYVIPGKYNLKVKYNDNTSENVVLNIKDRKFTPTFKVREIRINRTTEKNFDWIMENEYLGTYMTNSNLITYSLDYFNIPSDCKVDTTAKYLYGKIHFKLNGISEGSPYRNELIGNAVEVVRLASSNGQWCFRDSTWKKDQRDTLTLMFGDVEYDQITISTYDEPGGTVYIRGISDEKFNHTFNVNQEYTLRDLFGFYPYDAEFSLKMSTFKFQDYNSSELSFRTVSSTTPTTWKDFYDNYMRVKVLKKGYFNCYVYWKTSDGGLGGKMLIYLRGVTDGSGKPSSASGPLN